MNKLDEIGDDFRDAPMAALYEVCYNVRYYKIILYLSSMTNIPHAINKLVFFYSNLFCYYYRLGLYLTMGIKLCVAYYKVVSFKFQTQHNTEFENFTRYADAEFDSIFRKGK